MDKIRTYLDVFYGHGVGAVSLYLLSKANLRRTEEELAAVCEAEGEFLRNAVPPLINAWNLSVRVAGHPAWIPRELGELVYDLPKGRIGGTRRLYLCIAYDPFDELLHALGGAQAPTSREALFERLWVSEEIDLVVRTGDAVTLSSFLPLQCSYARVVFMDELFNDTSIEDFMKIITNHEERSIKYGE